MWGTHDSEGPSRPSSAPGAPLVLAAQMTEVGGSCARGAAMECNSTAWEVHGDQASVPMCSKTSMTCKIVPCTHAGRQDLRLRTKLPDPSPELVWGMQAQAPASDRSKCEAANV